MLPRLLSLVALLPIAGCATATPQAKAPGRYVETVGGRKFTLIVPKGYDGSRRLPLVVLLHGWRGSGREILSYSGMALKADQEGFLLAVPEGLGDPAGWNVGFIDLSGSAHPDDVGFVGHVIDQVERETRVDEDRVFVAGHSNGAMLAELVGARLSERVAAVGAMAGTIGLVGPKGRPMVQIPAPKNPVSVLLLHGMADPLVSYDESHRGLMLSYGAPATARWWARQDGCASNPAHTKAANGREEIDTYSGGRDGAEVVLITYPQGRHLWSFDATDQIWSFFANHPRKKR